MYFEIIGEVVRGTMRSLAEHRNLTYQEICDQVVGFLHENRQEHFNCGTPDVRYGQPACRIAYLYNHVAANAGLMQYALDHDDDLSAAVRLLCEQKRVLSVCAFGGGPGTELLALSKWIELISLSVSPFIRFYNLERVNAWQDTWFALNLCIEQRFAAAYGFDRAQWPWIGSCNFGSIDMADTDSFGNFGTLFGHDLFVLSYVLSEVYDRCDELGCFIRTMAQHAPEGARFVFLERNQPEWKTAVERICRIANLTASPPRVTQTNMARDEQASVVRDLRDDLKGWHPRVKWNAFWVVATKS